MDRKHRKARAQALVNDEMFEIAHNEIVARLTKELLTGKTQEEREQKFQEIHGAMRLFNLLKVWAAETVDK